MGNLDPGSGILEFALSKEVEAYHFYMAVARHVDSPKIREVFEELAAEELEHKAKLELEIMKTGKVVPDGYESAPGPDSDYIVDEDNALLDMDYRDMLLLAMEKEKAAFRTYVNLMAETRDEQTQELLLALAEEEVKHKLRFKAEYEQLVK
ncbi:MAG: ferritin-like domain-containing protein [Phycisphaerales bacterium]|nr:MAG: ferritin-like domain-containing protein [Phycisphaerales bacterium]UCF15166.1 MAG: ferritin-like domain-containing protein [Phycisphaerales bacterium]